jgi:hypothetical protein
MFWLWAIGAAVIVFVVGPIRKAFFAAWRFTLPAVAGLVGGIFFTSWLVSFGVPDWSMYFLPTVTAFGCGTAGKGWLDQNLGSPGNRKP